MTRAETKAGSALACVLVRLPPVVGRACAKAPSAATTIAMPTRPSVCP
jgi:hypothetical protein